MKKFVLPLLFVLTICCISRTASAQNSARRNHNPQAKLPVLTQNNKIQPQALSSALSGYYFEGFESSFPPVGWQVIDVMDNTNTWTESANADWPAAYEGLSSAYIPYTMIGVQGEDWLIAPKFSVAAGDSFSFQLKLEYFGYPPDTTFILVSTTDSLLTSFNDTIAFYAEGLNYPQDSSFWHYKTFSLVDYVGQDIYIAFKNVNIYGDGVFIDNVEIGTRPAKDAGVMSVDVETLYPAGISTPVATVKNFGGSTQTFNVSMNITGGYTSVKSVTLPAQGMTQVTFDPWNATLGIKTISVQTLLTGDVNNANDTASLAVRVLETFLNYGWSVRDNLVNATYGGAAVAVNNPGDTRYYLLGGVDAANVISDAFDYQMNFGSWASINPMLSTSCYGASASANGKLFVLTGATVGTGTPDPATKIYDIALDAWSTGTPCPVPVTNFAFGTYKDSLVYIIGGNIGGGVSTNLVQIYNLHTDSWTSGTPKPGTPLFASRAGITGNKIVVVGGVNPVNGEATAASYVGEIDILNPSLITWNPIDDHPAGVMSRMGSAVSLDPGSGLVVFAGGSNTNSFTSNTRKTLAYDVSSNSWKLGPDKPTSLTLFYMATVFHNDSVYLAALGGYDGTAPSNKNEWLNMGYYQLPTGSVEVNSNSNISYYPNPAVDELTIQINLEVAAHVNVKLVDLAGKSVLELDRKNVNQGESKLKIDTSGLSKGMYFCIVEVDGLCGSGKIIKN
jgi:hypothetical protein